MTFVESGNRSRQPLEPGRAIDRIDGFFRLLGRALDPDAEQAQASRNPIEGRLNDVQEVISDVSMHLPNGFAVGLNRQFANLLDDEAWEEDDELINMGSLKAFLLMLTATRAQRRPGIGTNGKGSITAAWTGGENRLTMECLPDGKITIVFSRRREQSGEFERAAFGPILPERVPAVLAPFEPEIWFEG